MPQDRLYDARLKLAGSGLTGKETGGGFELMEKDPGFGVSQFVENARYQHALETELSRTIGTLRPVREARVHLAIPKPSAFTRQRDVASASVVLELRGGQGLERNQVDAIVNLVASSIPDMTPSASPWSIRVAACSPSPTPTAMPPSTLPSSNRCAARKAPTTSASANCWNR